MNIYKKYAIEYLKKGISVIPDKYESKMPLIKGWSDYCEKLPTEEEIVQWSDYADNKGGSNISVCLGKASNIIALDFDCDDPKITTLLEEMDILPKSPVGKVSSKAERFTRFFKYTGEKTEMLKFNGQVVLEILSDNKKTTIPPSIHPNGAAYKWSTDETLLTVKELPVLPPSLISSLELILKTNFSDGFVEDYGKVVSGRNDALSKHLTTLVNEHHTVDDVVTELIKFDKENHENPLFSDPNENRHTEPYSNAHLFYANHINSYNTKRMRENKQYIVPVMESVTKVEEQEKREVGKSISKESQKKSKVDYLVVPSVLKSSVETILKNSWIKQPDLAFGASLALMAVLTSRKFVYQGISPNLYILNVSNSGTGKNHPMEFVKNTLAQIGAQDFIGAGDYVSDASLMDSLPTKNTRLDIMDEVGGILKTVTSGKSEYNSKMADVLAELYTSSNSYYPGRAVASGYDGSLNIKGACYRPNVNILGSTTPTGFEEGVSKKSIDKGLLGRFLIFIGSPFQKATRVKKNALLEAEDVNQLSWLYSYVPKESGTHLNQIDQRCTELSATPKADKLLDEVFENFDKKRIETIGNTEGPITARLYQQMIKLVIIHAAARSYRSVPVIDVCDVEFGYNVINAFYEEVGEIVNGLIFNSPEEKNRHLLLDLIKNNFKINKKSVILKTPKLNKRSRDAILEELVEAGQIQVVAEKIDNKLEVMYYAL